MNIKSVYVVNYKETKKNEKGELTTSFGTCDFGYEHKEDAIKRCYELTDRLFNQYLEENDEELERDEDNDNIYREVNADGSSQSFHYFDETYEYWITLVDFEEK